jgi:hypothetical protein
MFKELFPRGPIALGAISNVQENNIEKAAVLQYIT